MKKDLTKLSKIEVYNYHKVLRENLKTDLRELAETTLYIRRKSWAIPAEVNDPMILKAFERIVDGTMEPEVFLLGAPKVVEMVSKLSRKTQKQILRDKTIPVIEKGEVVQKSIEVCAAKQVRAAIAGDRLRTHEELKAHAQQEKPKFTKPTIIDGGKNIWLPTGFYSIQAIQSWAIQMAVEIEAAAVAKKAARTSR